MTSESTASGTTHALSTLQGSATMSPDAAFQLAQSYRTAGRHESAERVYHNILQAVPDHPLALFLLGVMALQFGRCAVAEQRFRAVLRQRPNNVNALAGLASALHELGRSAEGERAARRSIELDDSNAQAHSALGRILLTRSRRWLAPALFAAIWVSIAMNPMGGGSTVQRAAGMLPCHWCCIE